MALYSLLPELSGAFVNSCKVVKMILLKAKTKLNPSILLMSMQLLIMEPQHNSLFSAKIPKVSITFAKRYEIQPVPVLAVHGCQCLCKQ